MEVAAVITVETELLPFTVPNYVLVKRKPGRRQDGINFDGPKYHLSELPHETLEKLCAQFRGSIFEKAAKGKP